MKPTQLSCVSISKSYTQAGIVNPVLHQIDADFKSGKTYALMGVSGSGKSTLIHLLAGIESPDQGHILCNDKNITNWSEKERQLFFRTTIAIVFQKPYLIKELTALENVMLPGLIAQQDTTTCNDQAKSLLHTVGLEKQAHQKATTLSGGQQQRVALARALFIQPQFLLADEPTGSLDEENAQAMLKLILSCQKEWGMGIIISTHDPSIAKAMQVVYVLSNGSLHQV